MMDRLSERWQHRRDGAPREQPPAMVPVTVSEQVTVKADADRLWRLVWDPATSPLVFDHVMSAFTLPGTPAGKVGEMQMHVVACQDGTLVGTIEEVVELGPGYRAVTRSRSSTVPATSTTLILPLDQGGCVLRFRLDHLVPADTATAARGDYQDSARRYLSRVRELAEASPATPLAQPGDTEILDAHRACRLPRRRGGPRGVATDPGTVQVPR